MQIDSYQCHIIIIISSSIIIINNHSTNTNATETNTANYHGN